MEREKLSYRNPPPLTEEEAERSYAPDKERDKLQIIAGRGANAATRQRIGRKKLRLDDK